MTSLIKSFFIVGFVKFLSAFSGLFLTALATRYLSIQEAGYFLFALTFSFVLSIIYRRGIDNLVLRDISNLDRLNSNSLFSLCFFYILKFSLLILSVYCLIRFSFFSGRYEGYLNSLDFLVFILIPLSLLNYLGFIFQARSKFFLASYCQSFGVNTISIVLIFFSLIFVEDFNDYYFYIIYLVSTILSFLTAFFFVNRSNFKLRVNLFFSSLDSSLDRTRKVFFHSALLGIIIQWGSYLASTMLLEPQDIAVLSVANRFAFVLGFILTIVNTVSIPIFMRLVIRNDYKSLKVVSCFFSFILASATIPLILILVLNSREIMAFFGSEYENYYYILQALLFGQFANVLTGSVAYLLNLTGHENDVRLTNVFVSSFIVFFALPITYYFGLYGVAIFISFSITLQNLALFLLVRRRLNFWLLPKISKSNVVLVLSSIRKN